MRLILDASVVRQPAAGVQLAVAEECAALAEAWNAPRPASLTVLAGDRSLLRRAGAVHGVGTVALPGFLRTPQLRLLWQQFRLPSRLRREPDCRLFAMAYTAPRRCPVPYALNVFDTIAFDHPELCAAANRLHMRLLMPGSIRGAAAVLVPSQATAGRVRELFGIPAARLHCLPLGVDAAFFSRPLALPPELAARLARPYILFVGNLEPKKGLPMLLDAYAHAAGRLNCDLVLAGRPAWERPALFRRLRDWPGPGRVHLLGYVGRDLLPALYQHSLCLAMPSLVEGFGLPVLEAMAAGAPVIHSNAPALLETAGSAGLATVAGDPESLAAALLRLHESPELQEELRQKGRERAASLTWRRWAEAAVSVLAGAWPSLGRD